jgi:transglutaminase-like putative cysteine protease
LLPSTLPLLIIQYYDGYKAERIWGLAFYFFLALILTGRINLLKSRQRWDEQGVLAGSDPEFDLNKNMAIAAAIIILAAWVMPAPAAVLPAAARAWSNFSEPFENTRMRINDMLAALNGQGSANSPTELYGSVLDLGRTAGSGDAELFRVHAPLNNLPRLYWRVRVYNQYINGNWQTSNSQNMPFDPDKNSLVRAEIIPAPIGEFVFSWQTNRSAMLVTPSLPFWASRTGSVQIANAQGSAGDPLGWNVTPNLQSGDQYQIRATLLNPTRKTLRNSGDVYPAWIKERYLQIPENISTDFRRLAEQITAGKPTAFDKAEAVTEYLRKNMTYSETIPAPPPGMDAVNWFLFSWKSGFCNYYASAEVLLLRSLGIPARMVVGYAQGKSTNSADYSVHGLDAHAWPEVYFSGIGWLEFEPTVNQQALVRPSGENLAGQGNNPAPDPLDGLPINPAGGHEALDPIDALLTHPATFLGLTREQWLWVIISLSTLALAGILARRMERRQSFSQRVPRAVKAIYVRANLRSPFWLENWLQWSEASSIERSFHAINQALTWLRKPQPGYATPAERAELLKSLIPEASTDIESLTAALEQTLYTPQAADSAGAARHSWNIRFFTVRKLMLGNFMEIR